MKLSVCILFIAFGCSAPEKKSADEALKKGIIVLPPKDFKAELSSASDAILIDVRKPGELPDGIIKGAINIDFTGPEFSEKIAVLDKEKRYFVYCKSGKRSGDAVKLMEKAGFENIYTLEGGLKNWIEQGLETEKP